MVHHRHLVPDRFGQPANHTLNQLRQTPVVNDNNPESAVGLGKDVVQRPFKEPRPVLGSNDDCYGRWRLR